MGIMAASMRAMDRNVARGQVGDFLYDLAAPSAGRNRPAFSDRTFRASGNRDGNNLRQLPVAICLGDGHRFRA